MTTFITIFCLPAKPKVTTRIRYLLIYNNLAKITLSETEIRYDDNNREL